MRTDQWIEEDFYDPKKICCAMLGNATEEEGLELYEYLTSFGMYAPNERTKSLFLQLKAEDAWSEVEGFFSNYKRVWKGPDIPIYIFPMQNRSIFMKNKKSGVSFKDKMFLFLSPTEDKKDLESLFIHEYHHVCRLNQLNKQLEDYTLLDSIVMEGLAEYAVTNYCGKDYNAKGVLAYTDEKLLYYWENYFKKYNQVKKKERIHDTLLYGKKGFPELIGYAIGYWLIQSTNKNRKISLRESFALSAEEIVQYSKLNGTQKTEQ